MSRPALAPRSSNSRPVTLHSPTSGQKRSHDAIDEGQDASSDRQSNKRSRIDQPQPQPQPQDALSGVQKGKKRDTTPYPSSAERPAVLPVARGKNALSGVLEKPTKHTTGNGATPAQSLLNQVSEEKKKKSTSNSSKSSHKELKEKARLARLEAEEEFRTKYRAAFPSWRFYFDGVPSPQVAAACRRIESLGAVVEEFLSKKVTHFITPTKVEKENGNVSKLSVPLPGGGVLKSPIDLKGAYNPLEKAKQWGCKIWDIAKLESVLDRTLAKPKSETPVTLESIFTPSTALPVPSGLGMGVGTPALKIPLSGQSSKSIPPPSLPQALSSKTNSLVSSAKTQAQALTKPIFSNPPRNTKLPPMSMNPFGVVPAETTKRGVPSIFSKSTVLPTTTTTTTATKPSALLKPNPDPLRKVTKFGNPSTTLAGLLATEKATNTTMERDPYSRRHDFSYFARGSVFMLVECLRGEWGIVGRLEYRAFRRGKSGLKASSKMEMPKKSWEGAKEGEVPEYPVLVMDPRLRCPFLPYSAKQERKERALDRKEEEEREDRRYNIRMGRALRRLHGPHVTTTNGDQYARVEEVDNFSLVATPGQKPATPGRFLQHAHTPGRPALTPGRRPQHKDPQSQSTATDLDHRASGYLKSMPDSAAGPPTTTSLFSHSNLSTLSLGGVGAGGGGIVPAFGGVRKAPKVEMNKKAPLGAPAAVAPTTTKGEKRGMQRTVTMPNPLSNAAANPFTKEDVLEQSLNAGVGLRRSRSLVALEEKKDKTAFREAAQKRKERERKVEGYCECCKEHYESLADHVQSRRHRKFATDPRRYKELDVIISRLQRVKKADKADEEERKATLRRDAKARFDAFRQWEKEMSGSKTSPASATALQTGSQTMGAADLTWLTEGDGLTPTVSSAVTPPSTSEPVLEGQSTSEADGYGTELDLSVTSASMTTASTSECVTPIDAIFHEAIPCLDEGRDYVDLTATSEPEATGEEWDGVVVISSERGAEEVKPAPKVEGQDERGQLRWEFPDPMRVTAW